MDDDLYGTCVFYAPWIFTLRNRFNKTKKYDKHIIQKYFYCNHRLTFILLSWV